jgi:hypothetical protein
MTAEHLHRAVLLLDNPDPKSIVGTCDFLISKALRYDRALLHAHAKEAPPGRDVSWFIDDRSVFPPETKDLLIYVSESGSAFPFRSILGRFGASYMQEGSLYGGFSRGTLFHDQKNFGYNLFMSNDGRSDFWIRFYTWKLDKLSES